MDKITVVVPIYNMEKYLCRAIDSLLAQTYSNYELILVDDGSSDNSGIICDKYAEKFNIVSVIHKENGGLSSARNAGIKAAAGTYIIFPDPDDWVSKNYLQKLIDLHERNKTEIEICNYYIVDDEKQKTSMRKISQEYFSKKEALFELFVSGGFSGFAWNKLYHMNIIKKNRLLFDEELGMAQDLDFTFRYLLKCNNISYEKTPVYYYYQHIGGVTNIKAKLTPRKISGLKTYKKMSETAHEEYPAVEPLILSTLANVSLQFLYIYYDSHMRDKGIFGELVFNIKNNKKYFIKNPYYSFFHKILGLIAAFNPKLYYMVRKSFE